MKPYHQQTYYELLEVPPDATQEEIRAAYERASALYAPDSVAIYSLADPAQADDLRKRILEAFEYLSEPDLRVDYDKSIGVVRSTKVEAAAAPAAPEAAAPVVAAPPEAVASSPAPATPAIDAPAARVEETAPAVAEPVPESAASEAPAAPRRTITPEPTEAIVAVKPMTPVRAEQVTSSITPPSAFDREPLKRISPPEQLNPKPSPTSAEVPAQLSMSDLLAGTDVAVASTNYSKASVSYIPHPPRPERTEGITLAAPSWASSESSSDVSTPAPRADTSERRVDAVADPEAPEETEFEEVKPASPPPLPPVRAPDSARTQAKRPEQLAVGAEIAQESAIASAEAALAQVASRVREARPKPFEIPPDAEFNGELLRKIRQAKNLSLAQVAERTKISGRHLENVEADRYDALPPPVYLRGIIMNIAREYGLDPLRVSKSYLGLVPGKK